MSHTQQVQTIYGNRQPSLTFSASSTLDALPSPSYILALPHEIIAKILNELDFESVEPFLTAYPTLKQFCVIFTSPQNKRPFFNIPGVPTLPELPHPVPLFSSGRHGLLSLCNLCPDDYHDYYLNKTYPAQGFTAPCFERLMNGPTTVFVHSTIHRESEFDPVHLLMMKKLSERGIKVREVIEEHSIPQRESFVESKFTVFNRVAFQGLRSVEIEFPRPMEFVRPQFSNIVIPDILEELILGYHGIIPVIQNVTCTSKKRIPRHFSLVDLDCVTTNTPPLKEHRTVLFNPYSHVDLSFTEMFSSVDIKGGDTTALLKSCSLEKVKKLRVTQYSEASAMEEEFGAEELQEFYFTTHAPDAQVPVINTIRLNLLFMSSTKPGLGFRGALSAAPTTLKRLMIHCKHDPKRPAEVIETKDMNVFSKLKVLDLQELSAPFIEDQELELKSLSYVRLNLVKELPLEWELTPHLSRYISDTLTLRGFFHTGDILQLEIQQVPIPDKGIPWNTLRAKDWRQLQPRQLHLQGFQFVYIHRSKNFIRVPGERFWFVHSKETDQTLSYMPAIPLLYE